MTMAELNRLAEAFNYKLNVQIAASENEAVLVDINRDQMVNGIQGDDVFIYPKYKSKEYAAMKQEAGSKSPLGVPDLLLTGDFQREMYLRVKDTTYFIFSADEKAGMLKGRYKNIFEFTPDNEAVARRIVTKTFTRNWKRALNLV